MGETTRTQPRSCWSCRHFADARAASIGESSTGDGDGAPAISDDPLHPGPGRRTPLVLHVVHHVELGTPVDHRLEVGVFEEQPMTRRRSRCSRRLPAGRAASRADMAQGTSMGALVAVRAEAPIRVATARPSASPRRQSTRPRAWSRVVRAAAAPPWRTRAATGRSSPLRAPIMRPWKTSRCARAAEDERLASRSASFPGAACGGGAQAQEGGGGEVRRMGAGTASTPGCTQ